MAAATAIRTVSVDVRERIYRVTCFLVPFKLFSIDNFEFAPTAEYVRISQHTANEFHGVRSSASG